MSEEELQALAMPFGTIAQVNLVMDEESDSSKGFGFIEMPNDKEGKRAIKALNGKDIGGNKIRVKTTKAVRKE